MSFALLFHAHDAQIMHIFQINAPKSANI